MKRTWFSLLIVFVFSLLVLTACSTPTPTPTPVPTLPPTLPPPTATLVPPTRAATATSAPTATPVPPTATPTHTPAPTRPPMSAKRTTLRLVGGDPVTLDPALAGDTTSHAYVAEIFSGLVMLDKDLRVRPDLAERWQISDDGKTYTFSLRKNARFHDGRPVSARDFKYSIERAANPALGSKTAETYLGDIVGVKDKLQKRASAVSGVRVVDDYTVEITIDAPRAYFLAKLTYPTAYLVDQNTLERDGDKWTAKPNGTGPFKLKEYTRAQKLVLARNEDFYLTPVAYVAQVEFFLGGGSPIVMYEKGELEMVSVGASELDRVSDLNNPLSKELGTNIALSTSFVVFNTRRAPFDDVKVRQAFALALDRQKLVDVVYRKIPSLANAILPPGMPGYTEPTVKLAYDPAKAKQLLAESKYAGKFPDLVWTTSSASVAITTMTGMLKENLGVNVTVQQVEWAAFLKQLHDPIQNPYQIFNIAWSADYADPQNFLDILFRSGTDSNWAAYANPQVDQVLDQAAVERDIATRLKLYQQVEQMILADYPVVPLTHGRQYWLTKPYVKDLYQPATNIPRLRFVWLSD
jgi:ABC-type transport system substrate-binding protein